MVPSLHVNHGNFFTIVTFSWEFSDEKTNPTKNQWFKKIIQHKSSDLPPQSPIFRMDSGGINGLVCWGKFSPESPMISMGKSMENPWFPVKIFPTEPIHLGIHIDSLRV